MFFAPYRTLPVAALTVEIDIDSFDNAVLQFSSPRDFSDLETRNVGIWIAFSYCRRETSTVCGEPSEVRGTLMQ